MRAVKDCVNVWRGFGCKPKVLSWDQEPALVYSAAEIWALLSLRMEFTPPDAHERVAERDVRTIKEHVYACILGLGHAVDDEMVDGLVRDTVTLLNFFPNTETVDGTPRTFLDGERLNYERWSRVYAGQVAEFEIPYAKKVNRGTRKELGYVIGHQGDNPIVRLLPSGKRLVVRSGHANIIEKSAGVLALIEQGIQGAKRQRYNDLLSEIDDFFGAPERPPKHLSITPQETDAIHQIRDGSDNYHQPTPVPELTTPSEETPTIQTVTPETPLRTIQFDEPPRPDHEPAAHTGRASDSQNTPLRRTTRAGAQKPQGFYAKLHSGESVSEDTACHMRAQECSSLYGEEDTTEAGITEVVNMIKIRDAAEPTDYRKLDQRTIKEALPSFMFFKAKDLLPNEDIAEITSLDDDDTPSLVGEEDDYPSGWTKVVSKRAQMKKTARGKRENKKKVKIRGRWVGGGHKQQRGEVLAERVAPTARGTTHNLLMGIAAFEGENS